MQWPQCDCPCSCRAYEAPHLSPPIGILLAAEFMFTGMDLRAVADAGSETAMSHGSARYISPVLASSAAASEGGIAPRRDA
jgi:hypothetical protein